MSEAQKPKTHYLGKVDMQLTLPPKPKPEKKE